MSGPILDLDTLRREYAVEGWEWHKAGDAVWMVGDGLEVAAHPWVLAIEMSAHGSVATSCPPRVAITVACAHLGLPTPWRLAERLDQLATYSSRGGESGIVDEASNAMALALIIARDEARGECG